MLSGAAKGGKLGEGRSARKNVLCGVSNAVKCGQRVPVEKVMEGPRGRIAVDRNFLLEKLWTPPSPALE